MPNLNSVHLIGNLTETPQIRHVPNGDPVTDLRMAINRSWVDQTGRRKEETTYVDVTAWGRLAEVASCSLVKGSCIFVDGYLKLESWESNGERRSKIKVVANAIQFLDRKTETNVRPIDATRSRGLRPAPSQGGGSNQVRPPFANMESFGPPPTRLVTRPRSASEADDDLPF